MINDKEKPNREARNKDILNRLKAWKPNKREPPTPPLPPVYSVDVVVLQQWATSVNKQLAEHERQIKLLERSVDALTLILAGNCVALFVVGCVLFGIGVSA